MTGELPYNLGIRAKTEIIATVSVTTHAAIVSRLELNQLGNVARGGKTVKP
jgi:hypothetical protein